jgi:hypothetical protein
MTEAATIAYPQWAEYRKKNGLDPLGMQNTSVVLYQKLLPGTPSSRRAASPAGRRARLSSVGGPHRRPRSQFCRTAAPGSRRSTAAPPTRRTRRVG